MIISVQKTTLYQFWRDAKYTQGNNSDRYRPVSTSYNTLFGPLIKSKLGQLSITYNDVQGNLQEEHGILANGYLRITKIEAYSSGVKLL